MAGVPTVTYSIKWNCVAVTYRIEWKVTSAIIVAIVLAPFEQFHRLYHLLVCLADSYYR